MAPVIQAMIVLICFAVACVAACLLLGVRLRPASPHGDGPDGVRQPRVTPVRDLPPAVAAPAAPVPSETVVPLQRGTAGPAGPPAAARPATGRPMIAEPVVAQPVVARQSVPGPVAAQPIPGSPRRPGVNNTRFARPSATGPRSATRA